ncbi:MAG: hypothetical protein Fur0028_01310 [Bacteroidales bacterium]
MGNGIVRAIKNIYKRQKYCLLYKKYKEFTMIPKEQFIGNLECIDWHKVPVGKIVECGVWKGGMIAAIAELLGKDFEYHLFDSFEGLPSPNENDGKLAIDWYNKNGINNCVVDISFAKKAMKKSKIDKVYFHKGWFNETIPNLEINDISVLRIDSDWYDSVKISLDYLFPKVKLGGILIIDDYYAWEGCRKSVNEYFTRNSLYLLREWNNSKVYYILKNT